MSAPENNTVTQNKVKINPVDSPRHYVIEDGLLIDTATQRKWAISLESGGKDLTDQLKADETQWKTLLARVADLLECGGVDLGQSDGAQIQQDSIQLSKNHKVTRVDLNDHRESIDKLLSSRCISPESASVAYQYAAIQSIVQPIFERYGKQKPAEKKDDDEENRDATVEDLEHRNRDTAAARPVVDETRAKEKDRRKPTVLELRPVNNDTVFKTEAVAKGATIADAATVLPDETTKADEVAKELKKETETVDVRLVAEEVPSLEKKLTTLMESRSEAQCRQLRNHILIVREGQPLIIERSQQATTLEKKRGEQLLARQVLLDGNSKLLIFAGNVLEQASRFSPVRSAYKATRDLVFSTTQLGPLKELSKPALELLKADGVKVTKDTIARRTRSHYILGIELSEADLAKAEKQYLQVAKKLGIDSAELASARLYLSATKRKKELADINRCIRSWLQQFCMAKGIPHKTSDSIKKITSKEAFQQAFDSGDSLDRMLDSIDWMEAVRIANQAVLLSEPISSRLRGLYVAFSTLDQTKSGLSERERCIKRRQDILENDEGFTSTKKNIEQLIFIADALEGEGVGPKAYFDAALAILTDIQARLQDDSEADLSDLYEKAQEARIEIAQRDKVHTEDMSVEEAIRVSSLASLPGLNCMARLENTLDLIKTIPE